MSTEPRTATVNLLVTKPLEIDEPGWCAGRHGDRAQFKPDITHYGAEHVIGANGIGLFRAMLAQSPFAERATTAVELYVEQQDVTGSYGPDGVDELADALVQAAEQLRVLGRELSRILAGGGQ